MSATERRTLAVVPPPYVGCRGFPRQPDLPATPSERGESTVERDQALEMALGQIEKNFGKGAIMRLGEQGHVGVAAIPTGALALDIALGIGGLPRGRVVEVFGP